MNDHIKAVDIVSYIKEMSVFGSLEFNCEYFAFSSCIFNAFTIF